MAAAFDNKGSATLFPGVDPTLTLSSFTVGGGSDRLLVVAVSAEDTNLSDTVVSDVTFNGTSITFVRRDEHVTGTDVAVEYWEDLVPDNVTADIVATMDGVCTSLKINAMSFTGIKNQTAEVSTGGDSSSESGFPSGSTITTVTNNALVVAACAIGNVGTWDAGTNYTIGSENSFGGLSTMDEYDLDAGSLGSITVDGTKTGGSPAPTAWTALAYEIEIASGVKPKGPLGRPLHGILGGPI